MLGTNQVHLLGNMCADARQVDTAGGAQMVSGRLAISRRGHNGDTYTDYISWVAFGPLARVALRAHKGDMLSIYGRITERKVTAPNGDTQYKTNIVADRIVLPQFKRPPSGNSDTPHSPGPDGNGGPGYNEGPKEP